MALFRSYNLKGDTLLEVIMALAVAVVILTSVTIVTINSLRNSRQTASQSTATAYAKDGLEIVRGMHNNDYTSFKTLVDQTYCLADTCTSLSASVGACGKKLGESCDKNVSEMYVREIEISMDNASCKPANPIVGASYTKVVSSVAYGDNQCADADNPYCHKTELSSCLVSNTERLSP